MCGGTRIAYDDSTDEVGLSPRVRGNRHHRHPQHHLPGSIPACAGEPGRWQTRGYRRRVYPRVCGGTTSAPPTPGGELRSIPACAGEPRPPDTLPAPRWVYPRVCGGTAVPRLPQRHTGGLSRVCGGTVAPFDEIVNDHGLSPRVRGNPNQPRARSAHPGSIPACAGEPGVHRLAAGVSEVYPRVCGGTFAGQPPGGGQIVQGDGAGLSPRVRGNRAGGARAPR